MQEVFEDISRKLVYADNIYRYIKTEINPYGRPFKGSVYEFGLKIMEYIKNISAAYDADKIVEQVAAEYNNGWIPCSERLPEEGGYYLVTYHGWSNGDYLPKFDDTYVRRLHYQKSERFTGWNHPRYCDDKAENDTNREVIAWQKLPQPYQPKGE